MVDVEPRSPGYPVALPIKGADYERPSPELLARFNAVSSATASAQMHRMGLRRTFVRGPRPLRPGQQAVGSALTLQFMPKREDIGLTGAEQERGEKRTALWSVIEAARPGDILVVQAFGDPMTGVVGEMLSQSFVNHGGVGMVIDGCLRDTPRVRETELPVWSVGATPNYASQSDLFPWAFGVPVAVGGVLVLPGDIVIADDDGPVCVPLSRAEELIEDAETKEAKETFSRMRLEQGGALSRYYPLDDTGTQEFAQWQADNRDGEVRGEPGSRQA